MNRYFKELLITLKSNKKGLGDNNILWIYCAVSFFLQTFMLFTD